MKPILTVLLFALILSGCSTIGAVRKSILGDPDIKGKDKVQYASLVEEKEAEFRKYKETNRAFMPFHYAAIVLVVGGVVLAMLGQSTKDEGAVAVLTGFALSSWALIAPRYIAVVGIIFGGLILLLVAYLVNCVIERSRHGNKTTDKGTVLEADRNA